MRRLTDEEIARGAKEFWTRTETPLQKLCQRLLPLEYATETEGDDTVVKARVADSEGQVWEGTARGSEPFAALKRKAFENLRDVVHRAARPRDPATRAVRHIHRVLTFPTLGIKNERDRNMRAGMTYGTDPDFQMFAEITDPTGRVWRATAADMIDVNRAIRRLLEDAAASGDDGAKAMLAAIDARPPPRPPRPETMKKPGA